MLAKQLKIAIVGMLIGATSFCIPTVNGQQPQTPSQRYLPTQVSTPQPAGARTIAAERIPTSSNAAAVYRLTDQVAPTDKDKYLVRQVTWEDTAEPSKDVPVPEILTGAKNAASAFRSSFGTKMEAAAPVMDQAIRSRTPRIAPEEISSQRAMLESQLRKIKQRTADRERELATMVTDKIEPKVAQAQSNFRQSLTKVQTPAVQTPAVEENFSASEFMRDINRGSTPRVAKVEKTRQTKPLMASRANYDSNSQKSFSQVRQVSQENDVRSSNSDAAIRLNAPAIEVETFGPRSIGVNKPATYEVIVKNNSSTDAERILVGINLPQWVEVSNVNLTTGAKEVTDGIDKARLVWTIDRISSGETQTATIHAIPRKAEMFDVGVEWTLVPRTGKANIRVTEPRLTMNISGPSDVEFGEVARYLVTVRNPGTGTAENVTVKLPEALGGERSVLGDIPPGEEEVFQVELLARTAGELDLIAQASGDGEIEASSERKITVRRAVLGVTMEGPAMKFSGDVGNYTITVTNTGDASANNLMGAVALPTGAKYVSGIDSVTPIEDGVRWQVGPLEPGQTRNYNIVCQLNGSGDMVLECGVKQGDLAASAACSTRVETVADLVLEVEDPRGPLPTNKNVPYVVTIRNRGSRSAKGIELVVQFSEGIEPNSAAGHQHRIVPGQVLFSPIDVVEPGQEVSFEITAAASQPGTHIFRAQLTCNDSDSREIAEGTTRYFTSDPVTGDSTSTANADSGSINSGDFQR